MRHYVNDQSTTRRFLSHLLDPVAGCIEFRVLKANYSRTRGMFEAASEYPKTYSGYYTSLDHLVVDCMRLSGINGYVTVNPVNRDLIARSKDTFCKSDKTAHDSDIAILRWLFVDIDPVRPSGVSSTDAELAAAVSRRDAILGELPTLRAASIWGRSGNGCWILARLNDLPNDEKSAGLVDDALRSLGSRYSDGVVHVDQTTKNPGRIMGIPGTWKVKGTWTDERPHRMATIDSPSEIEASSAA